jgi:uncharacterized membrane protein YphA (DoxX/SURF4 family)
MTTLRNTLEVTKGNTGKISALLWTLQVLLAALFLFAGAMKLILPLEALVAQSSMPGWFLLFIGVAELLGGLGLILPGLTKVQPQLTSLAASGLLIIMFGATAISIADGQGSAAGIPLVVGILLAFVAYGRLELAPHRRRSSSLTPATI